MKKLSLILLASVFTLSIYSCRETTEEKTEDSLEVEIHTSTEETINSADTEMEAEFEGTEEVTENEDME